MANSLLILSAAERDIREAFSWYESRQAGLGFEFLRHVDARIHSIERAPETCGFIRAAFIAARSYAGFHIWFSTRSTMAL